MRTCGDHLLVKLVVFFFAFTQVFPHIAHRERFNSSEDACLLYCTCFYWNNLLRADCIQKELSRVDVTLSTNVQVVDLSLNLISALNDACFQKQGLEHLVELSLRSNVIDWVDLKAFNGLRRLVALDLSFNRLRTLHVNTFSGNPSLKVLLLAGNNFANLAVNQPFLVAPRLQVMDLGNCNLANLWPSIFAKLPVLACLNLSRNHLTKVSQAVFEPMVHLKILDVSNNLIDFDPVSAKVVENLRKRNVTLTGCCDSQTTSGHRSKKLHFLRADVTSTKGPGSFQKIMDIDSILSASWANQNDARADEARELTEFEDLSAEEISCGGTNNTSLHESGNPQFLKEIFDNIPSFWAGIIGLQFGFIVSLMAWCAWNSTCFARCRMFLDKRSNHATRVHSPTSVRPSFWSYAAVDNQHELEAPPCSELNSVESPPSIGMRPETPPPAYHQLA